MPELPDDYDDLLRRARARLDLPTPLVPYDGDDDEDLVQLSVRLPPRLRHDIAQVARRNGQTTYHVTGTCKMGSDPMAVVDDRLRVHGIAGLRIVDASIMPTITSGNTNSPTLMIAEKGAGMIREDAAAA